ncbi:hypothetical protein [Prochlorococcus sp. MIT 1307]|uniref:hypothetical protein n=1 Tax=Prochlorococcus sp. MIT 1307 TaxID=3096219 RepID=UPI002A753819|nr:hypothetical protein [Prochlorococcus sp. MIT 1307]
MSQSRREEAASHLRFLRLELREMALMLKDEDLLPEAGEIRALYSQLEALLNVVSGVKKKKHPGFKDDPNTVMTQKVA